MHRPNLQAKILTEVSWVVNAKTTDVEHEDLWSWLHASAKNH